MTLKSPQQAAEMLGVSTSYLSKLRMKSDPRSGPKFIKIGKLVKYSDDAINAFIEAQTINA